MTNNENLSGPWLVELWGGDGGLPEDKPLRVPAGSREEALRLAQAELDGVCPDVVAGVRILAVTEVLRWSAAPARQVRENIAAWQAAPVVSATVLLERLAAQVGPEALLAQVEAIAAEARNRAHRHLAVVG
ncbi:hypothetical protein [Nocardia brasiliensis]|uniref:hypothetical protein n=1 Tax=Nocardia brasiliensis TaxID=37326 RepID=UPI0024544273|nr:hypothetical protein [Nocardia brasiliensis]